MSKGFCILAENNKDTDYVRQAYLLAASIHKNNSNQRVSIITDDDVPKEYMHVFDQVIEIPWGNLAHSSDWKIENRWKVYHITPYEETFVMDADMLVLDNIEHWWDICGHHDIAFTTRTFTYRGDRVNTDYYRKTFTNNDLPDLYSGLYYFKKNANAHKFFNLVEVISKDWEIFYRKFVPKHRQKWESFDVNCALAYKLLDLPRLDLPIHFTHMKPHAQHWANAPEKWTDILDVFVDDGVYIGTYKQTGILHYIEDEFITPAVLEEFV